MKNLFSHSLLEYRFSRLWIYKTLNVNDLAISNPIETALDLTAVIDDKAPVTINPGRFTQKL